MPRRPCVTIRARVCVLLCHRSHPRACNSARHLATRGTEDSEATQQPMSRRSFRRNGRVWMLCTVVFSFCFAVFVYRHLTLLSSHLHNVAVKPQHVQPTETRRDTSTIPPRVLPLLNEAPAVVPERTRHDATEAPANPFVIAARSDAVPEAPDARGTPAPRTPLLRRIADHAVASRLHALAAVWRKNERPLPFLAATVRFAHGREQLDLRVVPVNTSRTVLPESSVLVAEPTPLISGASSRRSEKRAAAETVFVDPSSLFQVIPVTNKVSTGDALRVSLRSVAHGTFLSHELDGSVTIDRLVARSFESWRLRPCDEAAASFALVAQDGVSCIRPGPNEHRFSLQQCEGEQPSTHSAARISLFELADADHLSRDAPLARARDRVAVAVRKQRQLGATPSTDRFDPWLPALVVVSTAAPLSTLSPEGLARQLLVWRSWVSLAGPPLPPARRRARGGSVHVVLCWDDVATAEAATRVVAESPLLGGPAFGFGDGSGDDRSDDERGASWNVTLRQLMQRRITHTAACERHHHWRRPTYRGLFAAGERTCRKAQEKRGPIDFDGPRDAPPRPRGGEGVFDPAGMPPPRHFRCLVMVTNADILFPDDSLLHTISATQRLYAASHPVTDEGFLITGRRRNCDLASLVVAVGRRKAVSKGNNSGGMSDAEDGTVVLDAAAAGDGLGAVRLDDRACELFGEDAQDFFIASPILLQWDSGGWLPTTGKAVPPLVVGGVAFDNWLVSQANKLRGAIVVDASVSVRALHINHGASRFESHQSPVSVFNSKLAHQSGGWSRGKASLAAFVSLPVLATSNRSNLLLHRHGVPRMIVDAVIHERYVLSCTFLTLEKRLDWIAAPEGSGSGSEQLPEVDEQRQVDAATRAIACYIPHYNQQSHDNEPPDAFSQPWSHAD